MSCHLLFIDNKTKLGYMLLDHLSEKEQDLFEKDYRFISLGRKPNLVEKALEKELRLSYPTCQAAS